MSERAKHIHQDGNRYWISTKSNINQVAEDRANELRRKPEELHAEIVSRLRADRSRGLFKGVHNCPESSSEVEDGTEARLVILAPIFTHRKGQLDSPAMIESKEILEKRGNSPRINRNSLVFLAPDVQRLEELMSAAASFLAWQSVLADEESLNLDAFQRRQAQTKERDGNEAIELRIKETWVHSLVPVQTSPTAEVSWDEIRISGTDTLAKRTGNKLRQDELLLPEMGGVRLRMELDRYLWTDKDHVVFSELVEWFPRYLYLPRVVDRGVLVNAVKDGASVLSVDDTFAISAAYDDVKTRYKGLRQGGSTVTVVENSTLIVKPEVAAEQDSAKPTMTPPPRLAGVICEPQGEYQTKQSPNCFFGSVNLDPTRIGRDAGRIAEEVVQHLQTLPGAEVEATLEIRVKVAEGVDDDVVRTVSENCTTLKFETHGFEKE